MTNPHGGRPAGRLSGGETTATPTRRGIRTILRTATAAVLLAAGSLVLPAAPALAATTYYVATNGSPSNPGTEAQPFAYIQQFISVAKPGDTVYVRGGVYSGETHLTVSGETNAPIAIRNYPGEVPVLDGNGSDGVAFYYGGDGGDGGSHLVIDGFVVRNYWRAGFSIGCCETYPHQTVDDITIRNNVVDRMGQNGISVFNGGDIRIEHNLVGRTGWDPDTGSWSSGVNLYQAYGQNNVVSGNVSYHNIDVSSHHTDGNGFILDLSYKKGGVRFENNVAFENGGSGIQLTESGNAVVVNNTTYENGKDPSYVISGGVGIGFYGDDAVDGVALNNNIAVQSTGKGLSTSKPFTNSDIRNNNLQGEAGYADPKFVDSEHADFRLRDDSPSIDAGLSYREPKQGLVFDNRALTRTTENQPVSWYRYAPDFGYITSQGEVAKLFGANDRPQGNAPDQGAFESGTTGGGNLIGNGTFDAGTQDWWSYFDSGATGQVDTVDGAALGGGSALRIDLYDGGNSDWQAQAGQKVPNLRAGQSYKLTFKAKGERARSLAVRVGQADSPYTEYLKQTVNLGSDGNTYTISFTPTVSGDTFVTFYAGGNDADVYIDDVTLT